MGSRFSLILFSTNPHLIQLSVAAGVDAVIVDWERLGKKARQTVADTQINQDTLEDLQKVRASTEAPVICRINPFGPHSYEEIEQAIGGGADEILLPMVKTPREVESVLKKTQGRCSLGILLETLAAVRSVEEFAVFPLSRVYVGLNDLSIERRIQNLFIPLIDGTLDLIRRSFKVPFGFGGLTLPERGHPIPSRLLIAEMARLDCQFSFLRRSFHKDIQDRDVKMEIPRLEKAVLEAFQRSSEQIENERAQLKIAIEKWDRSL